MAYLNATSFSFAGHDSREFGCMIGWFGDNEEELTTGLAVELERGEINAIRTNPNLYGVKYEDTLTLEFGLIPSCGKEDFTFEEFRAINNWLRGSDGYQLLRFHDDISEPIHYYAICTDIQDVVYNNRNGKKVVFTCNSPFGYTPMIKNFWNIDSPNYPTEFKVYNSSDHGIIYPKITITAPEEYEGFVTITNQSDYYKTAVISFAELDLKILVIDSEKSKLISGDNELLPMYRIGWTELSDIYWPRLVKGWNNLAVTGTCKFQIEAEFPRKVGIL